MKLQLPKLPKIDTNEAVKNFYRKAAPGMLTGFMAGKVRGVPTLKAHDWLMDNDLWEMVPENRKPWLLGVRPWGLSEWMDIEWLCKAFMQSNPPLATMIVTSPKFKQRMESQLTKLITLLDKNISQ